MTADVRASAGPALQQFSGAETLLQSPLALDDQDTSSALELERGTQVDRYTILERLGSGAMGVVYTAYDPKLDRRIALKLMRAKPGVNPASVAARLLREAQALARLSHPNVVTVHDADSLDDLVYLAMELIEGVNLGKWLRRQRRTIAEILAVFTAAGRGLAAAHAAGLVHRDFKPDNVLVGDDGRVCVVDFGIARAIDAEPVADRLLRASTRTYDGAPAPNAVTPPSGTRGSIDALDETDEAWGETVNEDPIAVEPRAGASPGAPVAEELAARPVDALTLAEIDTAEVEPAPPSLAEVDTAKAEYAAREPVAEPEDPALTAKASLSGVSRLTRTGALVGTPAYMAPEQHMGARIDDRSDQFSFCVALFEALYRQHPFPHKDFMELSLSVMAGRMRPIPHKPEVRAHVRRALVRGLSADPDARYPSMSALIHDLLDEPAKKRRRVITTALAASSLLATVAYAGYTAATAATPCEGAERHLEGIWDERARARAREAFLATELPYAARAWESSTETLSRYADAWVAARVEACAATHVHGEQSATLLDLRMACLDRQLGTLRAITEVFQEADQGVVLHAVEAVESLPRLDPCADRDQLTADEPPPTGAEKERLDRLHALLDRGDALHIAGRHEAARALFEQALAQAQDRAEITARALYNRGRTEQVLGDYDAAIDSLSRAAEVAEHEGLDELRAHAWILLGSVLGVRAKRTDEAERLLRHTRALQERTRASPQQRARLDNVLGTLLAAQGRFPEALEHLRSARLVFRRDDGEGMNLAKTLNGLGTTLDQSGAPEEALEVYREALEIYERRLGPDHPNVAVVLNNIAIVHRHAGRLDEAEAALARSLKIRERALRPSHPLIAQSRTNLGNVYERAGRIDDAIAQYEAALAIVRENFGESDMRYADALYNLGVVHQTSGRHERALEYYRDALARTQEIRGPDDAELAFPLTGLGTVLVELGRHAEAAPALERALELRTRPGASTHDLGEIRFALARALEATHRAGAVTPEARARALARARELARAVDGDERTRLLAERWLLDLEHGDAPREP
ncbi:MAG: tetratricopeptide repeat protein [Myxococcales bacterium]|nr:tetratricopeptide repeat protein [Myxococcales bacterium]